MTVTTGHKGAVKAALGKIAKTREYVMELRELALQKYSAGKHIKNSDLAKKHGVQGQSLGWLVDLKAVEDHTPPNTPRTEGRWIKWTYKGNPDGVVDSVLVDALIDKERKYQKEWRDQRDEMKQFLATGAEEVSPVRVKLPTGKKDGIEEIVKWIDGELEKNKLVPGYLKSSESLMLPRIKEVLSGLTELKEVIQHLGL